MVGKRGRRRPEEEEGQLLFSSSITIIDDPPRDTTHALNATCSAHRPLTTHTCALVGPLCQGSLLSSSLFWLSRGPMASVSSSRLWHTVTVVTHLLLPLALPPSAPVTRTVNLSDSPPAMLAPSTPWATSRRLPTSGILPT